MGWNPQEDLEGWQPEGWQPLAGDEVLVEVPDVVGDDQATGTAALEGEGFVVAVVEVYSAVVTLGDIISQDPAGGSMAAEGSTVSITVSLGPATGVGDILHLLRRRGRR